MMAKQHGQSFGPGDALALVAVLAPLGLLYALTLCPTVWWYDSGEFAARAVSLRPAHAPGYPSYLLIAHLFAQLGPEPAWGTNLMSACFALGSVAAAFVLQRSIGVRAVLAGPAAFALGVSPVLWANAVITEVYAAGLCCTLVCLCLLVVGQARARVRMLALAAALAGFGFGLHLSLATCGLGFVVLAAAAGMDTDSWPALLRVFTLADARRRLRVASWCVGGLALGLSVYLLFPLLSFEHPFSRGAWSSWGHLITASVFRNKFVEATAEAGLARRNLDVMVMHLGWPGLVAAALGLGAALWRRPLIGLALALAAAGNLWTFWNYKVHDPEVFFLPAAAIGFVLVGFVLEQLAAGVELRVGAGRPWVSVGLATALVGWTTSMVPRTYAEVDASEATEARDYAELLVAELPIGARFVTYNHPNEWKYYGVLQYVQQGLGLRPDVRVSIRPSLDELDEALAAGADVFVFCDVARARRRVVFEPDGPLLRVVGTRPRP